MTPSKPNLILVMAAAAGLYIAYLVAVLASLLWAFDVLFTVEEMTVAHILGFWGLFALILYTGEKQEIRWGIRKLLDSAFGAPR